MLWVLGFVLSSFMAQLGNAAVVKAEVQPSEARPNQPFNYSIVIENGRPQAVPALRLPLQIVEGGGVSQSNEIRIINQMQTVSLRFTWQLLASEPGDFVIAPQDVQVDGQILKTNEVKIKIVEGAQPEQKGNEPLLQISVEKTEFYQSEVVPIKAALYIHRSTNLRRIGLVEVAKTDFAIQRFPQQSEQSMEMIGDQPYYVLTFRSTLSALKTGKLEVGPAAMEVLIDEPPQERSGFPPGFFLQSGEPRKFKVNSPAVAVTVLSLPTEGKPADFTGAVGDFTLEASASPQSLSVGEPITVELSIRGTGNFDALTSPSLTNPKGWKLYPSRRYNTGGHQDPNQPVSQDRQVGFTQVLVPEMVHTEVSPFEISFFSTKTRKYETLRTPAIPVAIKPAPAADPAAGGASQSLAGSGVGAVAPPPVRAPEPEISDILEHLPANPNWVTEDGPELHKRPIFWILNSLPVLLVVGLYLRSVAQRRRERLAGSPEFALQKKWQSLQESGISEPEFFRRAALFVQAAGPVTISEGAKAILDRYESTHFSGVSIRDAEPVSSAVRSDALAALAPLLTKPASQVAKPLSVASTAAVWTLGLLFCLSAGNAPAATPTERYREIVQSLEKKDFARTQSLSESLMATGAISPELFEVMGHTRYRQGDLGRAVLWYERASLFTPHVPEIRQNLRHLDEKTRYLKFSEVNPLESFGLLLYRNTWLILASVGFWSVFLGIAGWMICAGREGMRRFSLVAIVVGALVLPIASLGAVARPQGDERVKDVYVVTQEGAKAFTAASTTSGTVIDLPPGSQLRLQKRRGSWSYVEIPSLPNNLRGWVESDGLTSLWPDSWSMNLVP